MSEKTPEWAAPGDLNAFFGLMLDNIADLLLTVSLLATVFQFPAIFALQHMVPGTAIGVLVGDLLFFWMAIDLARRTGRNDITAMPLGLDTPSTFGMVFFVLGPAFLHAKGGMGLSEEDAATYAWHIGICSIVWSGLFKVACSFGSGWIRSVVPRAGLLGSLAAVALVLISFLPLLEVLHFPIVGLISLSIILTTLVARIELPWKIPGTLGSLLIGGAMFYALQHFNLLGSQTESAAFEPHLALWPTQWLTAFRFEWMTRLQDSLAYLPIVIPFALGTVIGGIDCTESAAAAGDEFDTNRVIGVEALATLVAGLCGGVIQTTPYIGHPAYKAMGGRSAYVLATALFVGAAGVIGFFGYMYTYIPPCTVFPILIFIGLEITAQSFHATPGRHYAAVAIACVPALAALGMIFVDDLQGRRIVAAGGFADQQVKSLDALAKETGLSEKVKSEIKALRENTEKFARSAADPGPPLNQKIQTMRMLQNGFIVTSLLWASILAALIDRRLLLAAGYVGVCAVFSLFGVIHSPLPGSPLVNPLSLGELPELAAGQTPLNLAAGYGAVAVGLMLWHVYRVANKIEEGPLPDPKSHPPEQAA